MSERDLLLGASNKSSDDKNEEDKKTTSNSAFNWGKYSLLKNVVDAYKKENEDGTDDGDDDDDDDSDNTTGIAIFRLYPFIDRKHLFSMFVAICLVVLHTVTIVASLVVQGRLTGFIAMESFPKNCYNQQQNSSRSSAINSTCSMTVELNTENYTQFRK
ncbi:unnamed protein product [Adineta ricciae]|uniref:Uncharacterized protein n=1 Tax=Adineta ricciae TaxID=249248 RepID=A0A816DLX4_ADIRI|nr:unnamed protein product [Adineta ricciae]CAF1638238.1 unnamed protein product [Adineta ricciae]